MPDPEERRNAQTPTTADVPEDARAELALSAGEGAADSDAQRDDEGDDEATRAPVVDDDRRRQAQAWTASGSLG